MDTIKVETWLPVFSGYYLTIWGSDIQEEQEIERINEMRKEKGLPPVDYDAAKFDYGTYHLALAESITKSITMELEKLGLVTGGKMQALNSPREYNFATDSIDVVFELSPTNVVAITAYLDANSNAFAAYLKKSYTSYDGFMPYYSADIEDWTVNLSETLLHPHKLGAILNFILLNEDPEMEMDIYEDVQGNGPFLECENYVELTGGK